MDLPTPSTLASKGERADRSPARKPDSPAGRDGLPCVPPDPGRPPPQRGPRRRTARARQGPGIARSQGLRHSDGGPRVGGDLLERAASSPALKTACLASENRERRILAGMSFALSSFALLRKTGQRACRGTSETRSVDDVRVPTPWWCLHPPYRPGIGEAACPRRIHPAPSRPGTARPLRLGDRRADRPQAGGTPAATGDGPRRARRLSASRREQPVSCPSHRLVSFAR